MFYFAHIEFKHPVVRSNFFVRFVEELKIPKRYFEINWPLLCALRPKKMQSRGKKRKYSIVFGWPTIETTDGRDLIRRTIPTLLQHILDFFFDPPIHYITIIKWVWHTQSFCWRYIGMVPINTRISAKTFFRGSKDQSPWVKVLDFSWLLVLKPKNPKILNLFWILK